MALPVSNAAPSVIPKMEDYEREMIAIIGEDSLKKIYESEAKVGYAELLKKVSKLISPADFAKISPLIASLKETWRPSQIVMIFQQMANLEFVVSSEDSECVKSELKNIENQLYEALCDRHYDIDNMKCINVVCKHDLELLKRFKGNNRGWDIHVYYEAQAQASRHPSKEATEIVEWIESVEPGWK